MMISSEANVSPRCTNWIRSHPALSYFLLAFAISWIGALIIVAPRLIRGEAVPKFTGLMIFPMLLLGPCIAGVVLTAITSGRSGLRALFQRMRKVRFAVRWYSVVLIPPVLILGVLHSFKAFVSPIFAPNLFLIGIGFGAIAGLLEEVGWTGFAFPALARQRSAFTSALILGALWGLWHLPAVDYLGSATPHGHFFVSYFFAFAAAMMANRVLIVWLYTNTGSVLLAQLMHVSSTASLVVFSPPRVNAAQETLWYGAYALCLWAIVAVVLAVFGKDLKRENAL
jgi:uncharacterized protein